MFAFERAPLRAAAARVWGDGQLILEGPAGHRPLSWGDLQKTQWRHFSSGCVGSVESVLGFLLASVLCEGTGPGGPPTEIPLSPSTWHRGLTF